MADERMPKGSCPECYVAGTPERPVCSPHGHDVMLGSVTVCDPHDHAARRVAPSPTEDFVDRLEQAVHPEGRCADCGGGKPYWKHDRAALADYHPFVAPSPDAPGLREAAQNVVDRAHINMERKDAGLDPLPTRVSELERVLAASGDAPREHEWIAAKGSVAPDDLQVCAHPGCKAARSLSALASESHPTKERTDG